MIQLTDENIAALIEEPKPLSSGFREVLIGSKMKKEDVHKRGEIKVLGSAGSIFHIKVRQNTINPLNFSVILVYEFREKTGDFRLRRYNGKSHEHSNKLEGTKLRDFHIHYASERYQALGFYEDAYAEVTDRYTDLGGALNCLIADCNFILPEDKPVPSF